MNTDLLIQLEVLLLTAFGLAAGVFWRLIAGINSRLDKLDKSVSGLHGRIDGVKDQGHKEHQRIGERLAGVETEIRVLNRNLGKDD